MASTRKLTLTILGNAKGATQALGETESRAKQFGASMASVGKKAAIGLGAIGAASVYMGKQLVDAAYESQKVTRQTEAIIKATGKAAGLTADQVGKLSAKLSEQTGIDDELIQSSANLLLTFKAVKNQAGENNAIFDRTTQAVLDMGAVFGSSDAAAVQLGKALSDPTKGITALKKSGIDFTEAQKAQIATMQKSGDILGAQKLILAEVESQVGGTAAAMSTDFDRARVAVGNVAEDLGTLLLPSIEMGARFITEKITPAISGLVDVFKERGLAGVFQEMGKQIQDKAPIVLQAISNLFSTAFSWIIDTGIPMAYQYLNQLGEAFIGWIQPKIPGMIEKLVAVSMALQNWIVSDALPFLVEKMKALGDALVGWIIPALPGMLEKLKEFAFKMGDNILNNVLPKLLDNVQNLGDALVGWIGKAIREIPHQLVGFLAAIAGWLITQAVPKLLEIGLQLLGSLIKWTALLGKDLIIGIGGAVVALVAALPRLFVAFIQGLGNIAVNAVQFFFDKFKMLGTKIAEVAVGAVNFLIDQFNKIPLIPNIPKIEVDLNKMSGTMKMTGAQATTAAAELKNLGYGVKSAGETAKPAAESLTALGGALGGSGAGAGGGGGKQSVADAAKKAKQQLDGYISALKGMTSAQKSAQDAAKGVSKANADLLKANIALEEAQKRFNEVVNGYGIGSKQASTKQDLLDKAQRDVERSGYGVEQALFAVTDAELKLQELRATEGATPQDIREAEIALAEAKLSVKDAIDQQKEATEAYAEANRQLDIAINGAKEGSEEYKDVLDDLTKAQDAQRDAIDRVTEAREREAEAIDRVREAEEKLAEVRKETPDYLEREGDKKVGGVLPSIPGTMENPIGNVFANDPFFNWNDRFANTANAGGNFGIQERIANITVQAGIGDPNAIADATVQALRQYERTNGYIPVTAQYIAGI